MSCPPITQVKDRILELLAQRGEGKSVCPSEVARAMAPDAWRLLMEPVRAAARSLAADGAIVITQRGEPVDPDVPTRGAIRLHLAQRSMQRGRGR